MNKTNKYGISMLSNTIDTARTHTVSWLTQCHLIHVQIYLYTCTLATIMYSIQHVHVLVFSPDTIACVAAGKIVEHDRTKSQ